MNQESRQAVIPPYGVAIHDAIIDGDLRTMKALLSRAEAVLDEQGICAPPLSCSGSKSPRPSAADPAGAARQHSTFHIPF